MGTVPLLTKEEEIEIAKKREAGEEKVCRVIFAIPFFLQRLIALGNMIMNGKAPLAEIIRDYEAETEEDLVSERRRFFKTIEKIHGLYQKREPYLKKLKTSSPVIQKKLVQKLRKQGADPRKSTRSKTKRGCHNSIFRRIETVSCRDRDTSRRK